MTANDGTAIAFDRLGEGPPVILVCGGSTDRMVNAPLALLARRFTVFNYDRRGRGDSGDTPPTPSSARSRISMRVITVAGGSACVGAAPPGRPWRSRPPPRGLAISRLALWEPPYRLKDGGPRPPADTATVFTELISQGRRGDAVEFFMGMVVRLPDEFVAQARNAPFWKAQEALDHTLGLRRHHHG